MKGFAARYMFANGKDPDRSAEILSQGIRNPLLHSFTLYDKGLEIWVINRQPQSTSSRTPRNRGASSSASRASTWRSSGPEGAPRGVGRQRRSAGQVAGELQRRRDSRFNGLFGESGPERRDLYEAAIGEESSGGVDGPPDPC